MTTEQTLRAIAHYEIACGLDKDVAGMKGFLGGYLRSMTAAQSEQIRRYSNLKKEIAGDLANLMERERAAAVMRAVEKDDNE